MNLSSLADYGLVYLATPYSKYEAGQQKAFEDAANLAGRIVNRGVFVFSPTAHGHPMYQFGAVANNQTLWTKYNGLFESACGALLIAQMLGWRTSDGVFKEKWNFKNANKPVFYLDPEDLRISGVPILKQVERIASETTDWRVTL